MSISSEYTFVCIGPNVWGIGKTADEAKLKAQKEYGRKLKTYIIRRYAKAAEPYVDAIDGSIIYKNIEGEESILVAKVKNGKKVT